VFGIQAKNHSGTGLTDRSIGAFTKASFKEHGNSPAARSLAPDEPVKHQCNAQEQ